MEVLVYSTEYYNRSHAWYVIFAWLFAWLVILSILYDNIVGAIVLLFLLGWYIFFTVANMQPIILRVDEQYLQIGKKTYAREDVNWFMLEIEQPTNQIKNIIFVLQGRNYVHTFKDTPTRIRNFVVALAEKTTMLSEVKRTTTEKITRRLKL